jgi:pyruvate dehydrogenase E2 component (dihydrolipoamide acetyltransferase)
MATEIRMTSLSAGAEDVKLLSWLRKEGDAVRKGEEIAEVETDKATIAIEAPHDGIIGTILVPRGAAVRVDSAVALLMRDDEPALVPAASAAAAKPAVGDTSEPAAGAYLAIEISAPQTQPAPRGRNPASPLARRLARNRGIEIASVQGTGPRGRIVRADIERAVPLDRGAPASRPGAPQPTPAPVPLPTSESADAILRTFAGRSFKEMPLDDNRRTIAERLTRSRQTVPHCCLRRDIRVDALLGLRAEINERLAPAGVRLSVNDFFIKACAHALQEVPQCNAVWAGDRILQLEASDISVAVLVDGALYTPVLQDAHLKSISTISREVEQFVQRAKDGNLPSKCEGGVMTISNLGMHGVEGFDAIINTPQAAILAVGASTRRMVFDEAADSFVDANVVSVSLSVDHRVLDGVLSARLLSTIVQYILNPLAMIA